jgi:hypothetical protein
MSKGDGGRRDLVYTTRNENEKCERYKTAKKATWLFTLKYVFGVER